jgi:hypothetical protein
MTPFTPEMRPCSMVAGLSSSASPRSPEHKMRTEAVIPTVTEKYFYFADLKNIGRDKDRSIGANISMPIGSVFCFGCRITGVKGLR